MSEFISEVRSMLSAVCTILSVDRPSPNRDPDLISIYSVKIRCHDNTVTKKTNSWDCAEYSIHHWVVVRSGALSGYSEQTCAKIAANMNLFEHLECESLL